MCYDVPNDAELNRNGMSNTKHEIPTSSLGLVAPLFSEQDAGTPGTTAWVVLGPERVAASGWIGRKEIF
jgi:hypothetical protein